MAMVDWSALPEGVVAVIARHLQLIEDFIAFRATCSSWRQGTTLKDFDNNSCPKLPVLMLHKVNLDREDFYMLWLQMLDIESQWKDTEKERKALEEWHESTQRLHQSPKCGKEDCCDDEPEFMCLSKGKKCKFSIPELSGKECRSSKGWLIMAERKTRIMCLFHPLTRSRIPLPKAPSTVVILYLRSVVLSASPSETPDYVVMITYMAPYRRYSPGRFVGFWKPGNEMWSRVEIAEDVEDLNYYNGKFYGLTSQGQVWIIDVSGLDPNNMASKIIELPWGQSRSKSQLVECEGRLLIVAPFYYHRNGTPYIDDLEMVEIDVIKGSYTAVASLGSSTVFLGRNQAFSINANRFPGILEPNSIYFSDGFYRIAVPGQKYETKPPKCLGIWVNF